MKLGIVGSRNFTDYEKFLVDITNEFLLIDITEVISGGARGTDSLAKKFAEDNNKKYIEYPAKWDIYGKRAGFIRNQHIINASDIIIAFWDGISPGTKMTINLTQKAEKPLIIKRVNCG